MTQILQEKFLELVAEPAQTRLDGLVGLAGLAGDLGTLLTALEETPDDRWADAFSASCEKLEIINSIATVRALYADLYSDPNGAPNFARFTFLDDAAHRFYPDWDLAADTTVANLRTAAGQDPHNKSLHDLVGELSTRSDEFRRRWGSHNVRTHGTGIKHFHHHIVGGLSLAYESLDLRAEPGLTMTIYAAEPDSPTAHALVLLASWAATQQLSFIDAQTQPTVEQLPPSAQLDGIGP